MATTDPPATIYGVDFSAAADDAGRNTWIAQCSIEERAGEEDNLAVEELADASELLSCAPDRDSTIAALVDLIEGYPDERRAFGLDFPFGLPRDLQGADWHEFLDRVRDGGEWGELGRVDGPRSLYDAARERAEAEGVGLRRVTDERRGGQEPTGFRIKTQTYYGVSALLAELSEDVSIPPMDDPTRNTVVLETYPAATFRRLREEGYAPVHDTGYKRDTREAIRRRRNNVDALAEAGVEFDGHRAFAVATDHALDAVAAARATWRASESGYGVPDEEAADEVPTAAGREGYIYR